MTNVSRRKFIAGLGATISLPYFLQSCSIFSEYEKKFRLMPKLPEINMLDAGNNAAVSLDLKSSQHDFGTQIMSPTYGINSDYLGPVVRVLRGQNVSFSVSNNTLERVALHWHGLHIPGNVDGGPHQTMGAGHHWSPTLHINQRASMNWFHAHTHGHTSPQVYKGLAGVMLIEDEESLSANLPKTNHIDDFVVLLQDKQFDKNGKIFLTKSNVNNSLVVNGVKGTVDQPVPKGLIRLRILNASNGAFMQLKLSNSQPITVIASDGGLLEKPVVMSSIVMSPAERFEVIINADTEKPFALECLRFDDESLETTKTNVIDNTTNFGDKAIVFYPDERLNAFTDEIPQNLSFIPPVDASKAIRTRQFSLSQELSKEMTANAVKWGNVCHDDNHTAMGINGRPMQMSFINEIVPMNEYEIWEITAEDGGHPFHVHGCSFRILEQMNEQPPEYSSGWKDIVYVKAKQTSRLLVKFNFKASKKYPYMYHCHILSHEDCGMMGQFITGENVKPFSAPVVPV